MLLRLLLVLCLAGCDSTDPEVDAGASDAAGLDAAADSSAPDANAPDAAADAGALDAGGLDANLPDAPEPDSSTLDAGPGEYIAVAGARCSPHTAIGVFSVRVSSLGPYVYGSLSDSPRPEVGEPAEANGTCAFHQANLAPCDCADGEVCTHDRESCVTPPSQVDIGVVVHAGAESFTPATVDEGRGPVVSEQVPLTGDTFGMTVTGLGATITALPTTVPTLFDVMDVLTGTYDMPEAMDLTWAAGDADAHVYSLTNINHHVRETTFTECAAPASDGSMNIPGSMLVPLSVSTGLEFQRVEVIRFAAAELPEGCVEFRFSEQ